MIPWTYLAIDGVTILDKTARNIKQSYSRIETGGEIVRLANGTRVSLRRPAFDKYKTEISGQASRKPPIDHLKRGSVITVHCAVHFDEPGYVAAGMLLRPAVPGSLKYFGQTNGQPVELAAAAPGILFTAYRPIMTLMVDDVSVDEDEMGASVSWTITAEEV